MSEAATTRHEVRRDLVDFSRFGVVQKPLSTWERIYNQAALRKTFILVLLAVIWEVYARFLDNALLFPTFTATIQAFVDGILGGGLLGKAWTSIRILLIGYTAGILLAALLTMFAITSRVGTDFLETLTSMFNPLPAIALLPLALIWFGLGNGSLVFVLIHSVLWQSP
jgi:NitT/TauT family transport system permease protein